MTRIHAKRYIREELTAHEIWLGLDTILSGMTDGADLVAIYQEAGSTASFYIINKAWSASKIRNIAQVNTAQDIGTIFVVDKRIMPVNNAGDELVGKELPDWLATLHALTDGMIYVYDPKENYAVRPWHFTVGKAKGYEVLSSWKLLIGDVVDFSAMQSGFITSYSQHLTGMDADYATHARSFEFVHFGQLKFWNKAAEAAERKTRHKAQAEQRKKERAARGRRASWKNFDDQFSNFESFSDWFHEQYGQQERSRSQTQTHTKAESNYYTVLGCKRGDDEQTVKKAYRKMMRVNHPDVNPHDVVNATAKTQELNLAYSNIKKERGWK